MFALISPNEKQGNLYRVAEVSKEPFDVASPLFWDEAPQEVSPSTLWGESDRECYIFSSCNLT